ncbi:hypothetical protein C8R45DRAFT_925458 [Mycena sanguinolenta]|nr:hypothetical protein C8R45DRAFT_925458 [Mycena sanguinolenta]
MKKYGFSFLEHYEPPLHSGTWADFELFGVDKGEYETVTLELEMEGRGDVLIFRKIGLEKRACPALLIISLPRNPHRLFRHCPLRASTTSTSPKALPHSPPCMRAFLASRLRAASSNWNRWGPSKKQSAKLEEDPGVPKRQKLLVATTQTVVYVSSDEDSGSDVDDSSELEITKCEGPLFDGATWFSRRFVIVLDVFPCHVSD